MTCSVCILDSENQEQLRELLRKGISYSAMSEYLKLDKIEINEKIIRNHFINCENLEKQPANTKQIQSFDDLLDRRPAIKKLIDDLHLADSFENCNADDVSRIIYTLLSKLLIKQAACCLIIQDEFLAGSCDKNIDAEIRNLKIISDILSEFHAFKDSVNKTINLEFNF